MLPYGHGLRRRALASGCALVATVWAPVVWGAERAQSPEVIQLSPPGPGRIYAGSCCDTTPLDERVHVLDGVRILGTLPAGFYGAPALSPDGKTLYIATTYYSRLDHGDRLDIVELYDTTTLLLTGDIKIPPKRAMESPVPGLAALSKSGRYLFVQNATPGASVTIVDLLRKRTLSEVENAGCWTIWPSPTDERSFVSLCGDGSFLTVKFDQRGRMESQARSEALFDAENDPLFAEGVETAKGAIFISFSGMVHQVDYSGEAVRQERPWSVVPATEASAHWRPGGDQPLAFRADVGRLFIAMHRDGKDGSQTKAADEIWSVDIATRQRVQRIPGDHAIALCVSTHTVPPYLVTSGESHAIKLFDTDTLSFVGERSAVGAATRLIVPGR